MWGQGRLVQDKALLHLFSGLCWRCGPAATFLRVFHFVVIRWLLPPGVTFAFQAGRNQQWIQHQERKSFPEPSTCISLVRIVSDGSPAATVATQIKQRFHQKGQQKKKWLWRGPEQHLPQLFTSSFHSTVFSQHPNYFYIQNVSSLWPDISINTNTFYVPYNYYLVFCIFAFFHLLGTAWANKSTLKFTCFGEFPIWLFSHLVH